MHLHSPPMMAFAVVGLLALLSGCGNTVPPASEFGNADGATGADQGTIGDSVVADTDKTTADTAAKDDDVTTPPEDVASAAPTCFEALNCMLEKKEWTPGKPPPKDGSCMKGMVDEETLQADELVGCVQTKCETEFDAWDTGGAPQLNALFGCMIEQCAEPLAVCVGGEGKEDCAYAVKCLQACPPLDKACTVPCMQPTTHVQSQKTGKLLACIFEKCTLAGLATCTPDTTCVIKHCMALGA